MSNFACEIAFHDRSRNLLYYRKKTYAHWLEPFKNIELVKWSLEGNLAYFYEYSRNAIYDSVFLNLKEGYCYRINELEDNFQLVKSLHLRDREFSENIILEKLNDLKILKSELAIDYIDRGNQINKLFSQSSWHP